MRLAVSLLFVLLQPLVQAQEPAKPAIVNQGWNSVALGSGKGGKYRNRPNGLRLNPQHEAISSGLAWLRDRQSATGNWPEGPSHDASIAITSLSLLAMLGDGSTMRSGSYQEAIRYAVKWLRNNQQESGAFATTTGPHLLAALAMTEAYLLSDYRLLKKSAMKGVVHAQSLRSRDGGFCAQVDQDNYTNPGYSDPVLTHWGTVLFATAADAELVPVPQACAGVFEWLQGPRANAASEIGLLGASTPAVRQADLVYDQAVANAFTLCWLTTATDDAAATAARVAHADTMRSKALQLARSLPRDWRKDPKHKLSIYEWYCSSYALQQHGDHDAVNRIAAALASYQVQDGEDKGSWDPIGAWGDVGGRTWTTAMAVLTLEAPHRYDKIAGR